MNSFILKENICYSISKTELKTISGYVVCRDGKCAGVFEEFPEKIYSEYYPVGLNKVTVKGIKKGNAALILAHVKKGEGLESATQIYISSFYVDENNMLTLVTEDDGMFLINK